MRELKFVKRDKSAGRSLSSTKGRAHDRHRVPKSDGLHRAQPMCLLLPSRCLLAFCTPHPPSPPNPLCMLRLQLLPFMLVLQHC
mmetsp:Transcript_12358/g.32119  ORF Transcript_12358/g.32119 Transcript_12358/m.32119 type:complete len:84 (-) Transcript_12358:331-582(-)